MAIRNRRYGWLAKCPSSAAIADSKLSAPAVVPMTSFGSPGTFPVKSAGWSGHGDPPVDGSFYQWAVDHQKPFMICESGFQDKKVVTDPSGRYDKDGSVTGHSLITATCTAVKQYPQCVAYGIWNNGRGNLADFVDTSKASLAQYRAFARDPWFALTRS